MTQINENDAKSWVLALASIASFMAALDSLVVTTALGTIRKDLGASIEMLQWTVNAYNLSFAVLLLSGAALGDRFGRRRMFAAGIGLFVVASAVCGTAISPAWLIAGRALQGAGSALVMPLSMALLGAAFPGEQRAKALGIFGGVTGLALIAGPMVGGVIAEGFAWQWIFWINVPIGLVLLPLVRMRIPESIGPRAALDIGGLVLVSGAAFGVVWGLMRGNSAGWAAPEVATALIAGLVLAAAFVGFELRTAEPMLPMRLFRARGFAAGMMSSLLFYAGMYGVLFFVAQFFQTAQGFGPLGAGLRMLPWTATLFVFAPLGGRLVNRFGERRLVVGGLLLQALGLTWVAAIASPDVAYVALVVPMILAGAGVSLAMPAAQNAVIGAVAVSEIGKASGAFNMFRFLGGAFGIASVVAVFDRAGGLNSPQAFSSGFAAALGVAAALSAAGAVAGLRLPARHQATGPGPRRCTRGQPLNWRQQSQNWRQWSRTPLS
jgi:EmrB/QacA subfamily drug resistance transporter